MTLTGYVVRLVGPDVSTNRSAVIFSVRHSKEGSEDEVTTVCRNVGHSLLNDCLKSQKAVSSRSGKITGCHPEPVKRDTIAALSAWSAVIVLQHFVTRDEARRQSSKWDTTKWSETRSYDTRLTGQSGTVTHVWCHVRRRHFGSCGCGVTNLERRINSIHVLLQSFLVTSLHGFHAVFPNRGSCEHR